MARKTWITVKRGILEPKHYHQMGIRIWLYLLMVDMCDWEAGKVYEWRDKDAAESLEIPERTVRDWRQGLEKEGYISCIKRQHCQSIIIHNWTNPREYSGRVMNPQSGRKVSPSENGQSDTQTDTQTDTEVCKTAVENECPSSNQKSKVIVDDEKPEGIYREYEQAFIESTKLPIFSGGPQNWYQGFRDMAEGGAIPADIPVAVNELVRKKYHIISPRSIATAAINVALQRRSKNNGGSFIPSEEF